MGKKLTLQEFKDKANKIHSNFYSYSNSVYAGMGSKIAINCPIHGEFWQLTSNHISGKGCPKCKSLKTSNRCKHTTEKFIEKAENIHGFFYDYSKVNYKLDNKKITIICPYHGKFLQVPRSHLNGNGCPVCAGFGLSFEDFVVESLKIHKNRYNYSLAKEEFKYTKDKISIICKVHGKFKQKMWTNIHSEEKNKNYWKFYPTS